MFVFVIYFLYLCTEIQTNYLSLKLTRKEDIMKGIQSFQLNNFFTLENVEQCISNESWKAIFDHYCDQKKRFDNQVDLLLYFDIIKSIFDFLLSQGRLVKLNAIELYEQFCENYDDDLATDFFGAVYYMLATNPDLGREELAHAIYDYCKDANLRHTPMDEWEELVDSWEFEQRKKAQIEEKKKRSEEQKQGPKILYQDLSQYMTPATREMVVTIDGVPVQKKVAEFVFPKKKPISALEAMRIIAKQQADNKQEPSMHKNIEITPPATPPATPPTTPSITPPVVSSPQEIFPLFTDKATSEHLEQLKESCLSIKEAAPTVVKLLYDYAISGVMDLRGKKKKDIYEMLKNTFGIKCSLSRFYQPFTRTIDRIFELDFQSEK